MGTVAHLTPPATTLVLLLVTLAVAVATGSATYGGAVSAPYGITLNSVCGDASKGLLFAVGADGTKGVIYRIDNLTANGYVKLIEYAPGWASYIKFYACEVVDNYLFVVGEGNHSKKGVIQSVIVVYSITQQETLSLVDERNTGVGAGTVRFRDVAVKKVDSTYYIYALSVADNSVVLYYTSFTEEGLGGISPVSIGTGDGYGVSIWGNYLGLLWRGTSSSNLFLTVFDISAGTPTGGQTVTVLTGFTGARAAEAAYSGGFLVAAAGGVYRVYLQGGWSVEVLVEGAFTGDAYAMLVAEEGGAKATYMFTQVGTAISITAVDVVRRSTAYVDPVVDVGQSMEGFGDAYVVWVGPSMSVATPGTPSARPYMVYTAVAGASSSLIYYDLTRGGAFPYPVPEPWFVSLAILTTTAVAVATVLRRVGS